MNSKVQVECIHSETDVELQERINQFCEQRRRRQAVLRRRNQIVLLEQLKTKEDEPLKTIACIR